MILSKKYNEILKVIVYIESKKTINLRKVTIEDLMNVPHNKLGNIKNEKVKSFRMQEEFGPKKRIKP